MWQTWVWSPHRATGAGTMVRVLRLWWLGFGDATGLDEAIARPTPAQRKRLARLKSRLAALGGGDARRGLQRLAAELPDDPLAAHLYVAVRLHGRR